MILFVFLFTLSLAISWAVIRVGIPISHRFDIIDKPGGHKEHDTITPFVGGLGIFFAFMVGINLLDSTQLNSNIPGACLQASTVFIFLTGFADDIWHLDYKIRFLAQILVAVMMATWGGVLLVDLGSLLSNQPFELGMLALPFTVFATIGVINALNMIDGLDGLSGSVSFASLFLIAIVAFMAGEKAYLALAIVLMGGITGFLYYNLRWGARRRAAVFLGDNGSMLLGFLFSWILIDLTQGESRAITPVTAIWILAVPLMDAVGVMIRRLYYRQSPFHPDRNHLHHLLVRAGFRIQDIAHIIALIQLMFGGVGLIGFYLGAPEAWMLVSFIGIFVVYCYVIARPWRFVPSLRTLHSRLGLVSADCRGVFVGYFPASDINRFIKTLVDELQSHCDYDLHVYQAAWKNREGDFLYATIELFQEDNDASLSEFKGLVNRLKSQFQDYGRASIRQFIKRDHRHDRRASNKPTIKSFRNTDRRSKQRKALIYRVQSNAGSTKTLVRLSNQPEISII